MRGIIAFRSDLIDKLGVLCRPAYVRARPKQRLRVKLYKLLFFSLLLGSGVERIGQNDCSLCEVLDLSAGVFLAHERVVSGSIVCAPFVSLACGYVEALLKMVIDWCRHMGDSTFCHGGWIYITLSFIEEAKENG
jgi:hypothetical protein